MTALSAADVVSEREFQATVIEMARALGWRVHAERPAFSKGKWSTPIQGDAGFPDLVLVRGGVLLCMELKSEKSKPTVDQVEWIAELWEVSMHANGHVRSNLFRPSDMPKIRELLT